MKFYRLIVSFTFRTLSTMLGAPALSWVKWICYVLSLLAWQSNTFGLKRILNFELYLLYAIVI